MATITPKSGVIFTDGLYNVIDCGPYVAATAPTDGADTTALRNIISNVKAVGELQTTRVSNGTVRNRYHSEAKSVSADVFVPAGGVIFVTGNVYKLTLDTLATSAHLVAGLYAVCTRAETDATGPGETTKQSVMLDLQADFGS